MHTNLEEKTYMIREAKDKELNSEEKWLWLLIN